MTPDANDLCVFAVKRGSIEKKEIYCNSLYPFYNSLVEKYKNSPFAAGTVKEYVIFSESLGGTCTIRGYAKYNEIVE